MSITPIGAYNFTKKVLNYGKETASNYYHKYFSSQPIEDGSRNSDDILECPRHTEAETIALRNLHQFELEIKSLKCSLKSIEELLKNDPTLKELCQKAAISYQSIFASYQPPEQSQFNPENLYDQMTLRGLERNALERQLKEYEIFVERHPEITAYIKEKLSQNPSSPKEEEGPPLITLE
ncbi:MAG: hypothetical protein KR126chlam3_00114 [Chlamydiae bacterium]|nr:hypothetical protein [Chlamydiota bacterium]